MGLNYKDESKLHTGEGIGEIEIPDYMVGQNPDHLCGEVMITARIGEHGLWIKFQFVPSDSPGEDCCREYGWIQHEGTRGPWRYDNGTEPPSGGPGRHGAKSNPDKNPQGNDNGNRWDPNPWYGGSGDVKDGIAKEINNSAIVKPEFNLFDLIVTGFAPLFLLLVIRSNPAR